jgi:hypothetical protein
MYDVQQITNFAKQTQSLLFPDGTAISLTLEYKPMQYGWFITKLVYGTFQLQNIRIVISPNFLYQYKNQIPYGIGCSSKDGVEPVNQQDFNSGRCRLFILNSDEVKQLGAYINGN